MEGSPRPGKPIPPLPSKSLSFFQRVIYGVRVWTFKLSVIVVLGIIRRMKRSHFKKISPTYTKRYDTRPTLEHRVFIPRDWKAGDLLPLYINVHGGGFTIADAGIGTALFELLEMSWLT